MRRCLSYYELKSEWKCQDECLTHMNHEAFLCCETDHLTNFALLLIGNNQEDPCQSSTNYTLSWVSMGLVAGATLIIALSVLAIEGYIRYQSIRLENELRLLTPTM